MRPRILLLGIAAAVAAMAAPKPGKPSFAFPGKEDLTLDSTRGATLTVINSGKEAGTATLTAAIVPGDNGCALKIATVSAPIAPGASHRFPLEVSTAEPCAPGAYNGRITVAGGAAPAGRDVSIVVPAAQMPPAWKTTIYRWVPGWARYVDSSFALPVQARNTVRLPGVSGASVVLRREAGSSIFGNGTALVKHTGTEDAPGVRRLLFRVEGGRQAGKYSGEVGVAGVDAATKLEVAVKDIVLWPVLVTLGSVLLTFLVQRFISVKRPALEWTKRIATARAAFEAARNSNAASALGYDVQADFNKRAAQLEGEAARFSKLSNPTAADQSRIEAAIAQLEKVPDSWPAFVQALQQMRATLAALPAAMTAAPADAQRIGQADPEVVARARGLLGGAALTVEQWRATYSELAAAAALLRAVMPLAIQASAYSAAASSLPPAPQTAVVDAIGRVNSKLWRVRSEADLTRLLLATDLDKIALMLVAAGAPPSTRGVALAPAAVPSITAVEPPESVAQRIARRIETTNRAITVLAVLIALLFGLRDYYLDLPFGTLKDYAGLVLYGTGTKLALDLAHTTVQALIGRPGGA